MDRSGSEYFLEERTELGPMDHDRSFSFVNSIVANIAKDLRRLEAHGISDINGMTLSHIAAAIEGARCNDRPYTGRASGGLPAWQCKMLTNYISLNLQHRIAISDLAAVAGLSTSHFCRAFRTSFHCSPSRFVMSRRVERARQLLSETGEPLAQIAFQCGFTDQSHFTRVFHDMTGGTPRRFRRERQCN